MVRPRARTRSIRLDRNALDTPPSMGWTTMSKRSGHSRLEVPALMCAPPPAAQSKLPCQGARCVRRYAHNA
eukprot:5484571-Prymnesium_polylepis.1